VYIYLAHAAALQRAEIEGILRVQVVFDLQTLFRLSGVVTQARITRRGPRARVRTLKPPPPARCLPFAKAA
jgi:hypothetical protein